MAFYFLQGELKSKMPNWVMNIIEITFPNFEDIKKIVKGEEEFDFDKIIPLKDELRLKDSIIKGKIKSIEAGSDISEENLLAGSVKGSWCIKNWSTKENASDVYSRSRYILFQNNMGYTR